ncbi:MAG TPA: hypothetical protein V6D37_07885 [Candidatus Sericytochromatia bacterium]
MHWKLTLDLAKSVSGQTRATLATSNRHERNIRDRSNANLFSRAIASLAATPSKRIDPLELVKISFPGEGIDRSQALPYLVKENINIPNSNRIAICGIRTARCNL